MATQATGLAGPIGRGPAGDRVGDVVVIVIPFDTARFISGRYRILGRTMPRRQVAASILPRI